LFHVYWRYGREALAGEPPCEFYNGPRARPVVTIVVQANDNTVSLEEVERCRVLVKWRGV